MVDEEREREIWLIQTKHGWNRNQAILWLEQQKQAQTANSSNERVQQSKEVEPEPIEEDGEETEESEEDDGVPTRAEITQRVEEETIRRRKMEILDEIESQLETDKRNDELEAKTQLEILVGQKALIESQGKISAFWSNVLANAGWKSILYKYFESCYALKNHMCDKITVSISIEGKGLPNETIKINYDYLDKNGKRIVTELSDGVRERILQAEKEG